MPIHADLEAARNRWSSVHGVGPFDVLPSFEQLAVRADEVAPVSVQVAVAQAGPVQIELIQQLCDRPSIFRAWWGEGQRPFHQLATVTTQYDARVAYLRRMGYEVAGESSGGAVRNAYVDTLADFGFYTEIVESSPAFMKQLDTISRTCAARDGTDPVRLLPRDGYRVP